MPLHLCITYYISGRRVRTMYSSPIHSLRTRTVYNYNNACPFRSTTKITCQSTGAVHAARPLELYKYIVHTGSHAPRALLLCARARYCNIQRFYETGRARVSRLAWNVDGDDGYRTGDVCKTRLSISWR